MFLTRTHLPTSCPKNADEMLENCKRREFWTVELADGLKLTKANLCLWGSRRQVKEMRQGRDDWLRSIAFVCGSAEWHEVRTKLESAPNPRLRSRSDEERPHLPESPTRVCARLPWP